MLRAYSQNASGPFGKLAGFAAVVSVFLFMRGFSLGRFLLRTGATP